MQDGTSLRDQPTTMKLAIFDAETPALETWQAIASPYEIQTHSGRTLDNLRSILTSDTMIVVVDSSIAPSDFVNLLESCATAHPQHVYIGSGSGIAVNHIVELMQRGIGWFFEKPLRRLLLQDAMPKMIQMASRTLSQLQEFRSLSKLFQTLTIREREVLDLILEGISNKESANRLEISVRTVEARRAKVYHKFDTDNMVGLIRKMERLNQLHTRFGNKKSDAHSSVMHPHLRHNQVASE